MTPTPITFDAVLEPLHWGRSTYTVIRVPDALVEAAGRWPTRRVDGHIEDHQVNLGLNRTDVFPDAFLYAGSSLQRRLGAGPGDVVRCRLQPVDPDLVPIPADLAAALEQAGRLEDFERLTPGQRRRLLVPIDNAVRAGTRADRIAALVRGLTTAQ